MKLKYKRINRSVITYQSGDDQEALILAKLGMSNAAIRARTSLSDGQITYRLHKAKNVEENRFGYRTEFRNGVSPLALDLIKDLHAVLAADIKRNVVPRITHPEPQTINIK